MVTLYLGPKALGLMTDFLPSLTINAPPLTPALICLAGVPLTAWSSIFFLGRNIKVVLAKSLYEILTRQSGSPIMHHLYALRDRANHFPA